MAHRMVVAQNGQREALKHVLLTLRAQLRRLWLTVRLILLAVFFGLLGSLLDNACKDGRLIFFWQQPSATKSVFIWDFVNMTVEERRVAFPDQRSGGEGVMLVYRWSSFHDGSCTR